MTSSQILFQTTKSVPNTAVEAGVALGNATSWRKGPIRNKATLKPGIGPAILSMIVLKTLEIYLSVCVSNVKRLMGEVMRTKKSISYMWSHSKPTLALKRTLPCTDVLRNPLGQYSWCHYI